ncbi:L-fucose isomerase [Deinococcus peraridilitoris]|uniref:L-fucose isomerase family protein n=1 Tax=Deinococcus peraridilitoris (strain DSM 19664 / LMG 22246 / CIP 109416 / KR-200) TaxID=937777 RepID=L0A7B5_DEIPD|nr:L-fucose isomerase [Deinococcus peraridilitoris]AFZ69339.1 L-fucose isomerase family protein [Deinococcus peraridilitoris DSM 19664]
MKLTYVPIVRPMFRGAHMGLQERTEAVLRDLANQYGFELHVCAPIAETGETQATCDVLLQTPPDLLLIQHVTFATGDLVTPLLELDLPSVVWALPEAFEEGRLPQNALCGLNMTLSLPAQRTKPVRWLYGAPDDVSLHTQLVTSLRGASVARELKDARILQLGGSAPGFYRIESEPVALSTVDHAPLQEFIGTVANAAAASTPHEPSDYTPAALEQALKIETALADAATGYDAVALRCWPEVPEELGSMACLACARLADRGLPVACEGDTFGALSMLAAQKISGTPGALLDLTHTSADALMFWHCGNVAQEWASETRIEKHFNRQVPAVRGMTLKPGPVSGLRLLEGNRAFVFSGQVVERESRYEGVSGWVTDFRIAGQSVTSQVFLANILENRLPHHLVFALGHCEEELLELCLWLGYEVLPAREATGVVRWS